MIRIVGATKAECDSCRFQGVKPCVIVEREPSLAMDTLCLTHTIAMVADLMVSLLAIEACVKDGAL